MIVTATLDLSEAGAKPDFRETPTEVLVYSSEDGDLLSALAAINTVRLIREGHVFETKIRHSLSAHLSDHYAWFVDHTGEVIGR